MTMISFEKHDPVSVSSNFLPLFSVSISAEETRHQETFSKYLWYIFVKAFFSVQVSADCTRVSRLLEKEEEAIEELTWVMHTKKEKSRTEH